MEQDSEYKYDSVKKILMVPRIITGAFMYSVLMLSGVAWYLVQSREGEGFTGMESTLIYSLAAVAVIALLSASKIATLICPPPPENYMGDGNQGADSKRVQLFVTSTLVGNVFREIPATIGFVMTHLSGETAWSLGFSTAAFVAMLMAFPTEQRVRKLFPTIG